MQNTYYNHAMMLQPRNSWGCLTQFRAPFCVTGGRQAHWAQREQGQAVHEIVHSYIYSKEVTSSNLYHQLISYEGQRVLCGVFNEGRDTLFPPHIQIKVCVNMLFYFIIPEVCV